MLYKNKNKKYIKEIGFWIIAAIFLLVNFTPSYAQSIPPTYKVYGGGFFNLEDEGYGSGQYIITTANATNITATTATLNALVNWKSGYGTANLSTWFEYGITTNLGYSSSGYANFQRSPITGYANFATSLSKLNPNTLYYFRAAVQGSHGVVYGTINAFRTLETPVYTQNTEPTTNTVISAAPTTITKTPTVQKTATVTKETKPTTDTNTNFLPITILGWILLVILILILILTIKHLHLKFSEKKSNSHGSEH